MAPTYPNHGRIDGPVVIIGFGSIGQGTLPLIERHFTYDPHRVHVIEPSDEHKTFLEQRGVHFIHHPITPENARARDRQHEHPRRPALPLERVELDPEGVPDDQLLQGEPGPEAQRPGAEPADRAGGDLHDARALLVDPHLGVDGALGEPERARRPARLGGDIRLDGVREPGRGHVERLLEEGAVERVGLVEQREHVQLTPDQEPLERLAVKGMAFRSRADVTVTERGVAIDLTGQPRVFLDAGRIVDVAQSTVVIDRVVERDGLTRLTWRTDGGIVVDSYFRPQDASARALADAVSGILLHSQKGTDA